MATTPKSGQGPFTFVHRTDLHVLPEQALESEVNLHGTFGVDNRPGQNEIYYGMPGCGIMRISPELGRQEIIDLPDSLRPLNFHSTKIGQLGGETRLFLPANSDELVAVISLDGQVEFTLSRPEFEQYADAEAPYKPTDTLPHGDHLIVADGYGSNYISTAHMHTHSWEGIFGGKTDNLDHHHMFGTAHGINLTPGGDLLAIADRPHSRIEIATFDGTPVQTHELPWGSRPCGIDYTAINGKQYAVIGSLNDPEPDRPAPIYILDVETYAVISTIRPKDDLGIELADHIHNAIWHSHNGQVYLICQAWNPGYYFVLEMV